jgi:hypothetical protein
MSCTMQFLFAISEIQRKLSNFQLKYNIVLETDFIEISSDGFVAYFALTLSEYP